MSKCNNPECACSTGIHEGLTYGSGELDDYGYWEFPCWECARNGDILNKNTLKEEILKLIWSGKTRKEAIKELKENNEWLFIKCWPWNQSQLEPMKRGA